MLEDDKPVILGQSDPSIIEQLADSKHFPLDAAMLEQLNTIAQEEVIEQWELDELATQLMTS